MAPILAQGASLVLRTISFILPQHTKRLVLWCTLYSKMMCGGKNITEEQKSRLNKALSLCKDPNALELPSKLCEFISNDLDSCLVAARNAIRGEKAADVASMDFVHNIPSWLRYASDAFMIKDFEMLLATHQRAKA